MSTYLWWLCWLCSWVIQSSCSDRLHRFICVKGYNLGNDGHLVSDARTYSSTRFCRRIMLDWMCGVLRLKASKRWSLFFFSICCLILSVYFILECICVILDCGPCYLQNHVNFRKDIDRDIRFLPRTVRTSFQHSPFPVQRSWCMKFKQDISLSHQTSNMLAILEFNFY